MCACLCRVCMYTRALEARCLPQLLSILLFFWKVSHQTQSLPIWLEYLPSKLGQSPCLHLFNIRITTVGYHMWLSRCVLEIWTRLLRLTWQAFYWLNHLLRSKSVSSYKFKTCIIFTFVGTTDLVLTQPFVFSLSWGPCFWHCCLLIDNSWCLMLKMLLSPQCCT